MYLPKMDQDPQIVTPKVNRSINGAITIFNLSSILFLVNKTINLNVVITINIDPDAIKKDGAFPNGQSVELLYKIPTTNIAVPGIRFMIYQKIETHIVKAKSSSL